MAGIVRLFPDVEQPRGDLAKQRLDQAVRIAEALIFAAAAPLPETDIVRRLPENVDPHAVLGRLKQEYEGRGVRLVRVGASWAFRTADDLGWLLSASGRETRKLSRAAMETLAIIVYHQPTTRAEIEDIRGVAVAKGTLDVLLETGWIRLRGRRRAPGRPITYGTTDHFLLHFGLESIGDLPGLDELRGAGLFDERLPAGFSVPMPRDGPLGDDEEALEDDSEASADEDLYGEDDSMELGNTGLDAPDTLDRDPFA